ncbi:beta-lactamase/transpeptidase-like protein [Lepidopterella palustris CBS 459.81]|uniref:Beta-lactamase/transpeptidase-like protein n=1 Tax=Lepidopterella palustris CBS 459.81 TaxID=1314670 RepID=A0A8E2EJL2_9PEZI|nr:beta-lactamase/transpeptidase-like protein [Lepidopterella palustris CBS 459.81]
MRDSHSILDTLHDDISYLLRACHVHTASIAVRCLARPEAEHRTYKLSELVCKTVVEQEALDYEVSNEGNIVFLVASITKVLVAIAFTIAVEVEAAKGGEDNRYEKFKEANDIALTALYNKHKDLSKLRMADLPGNPSITQLLMHCKGIRSSNHRLFAPDGSALMTADNLLEYVLDLSNNRLEKEHPTKSWTEYSNLNYALVGMAIETLWGGTLRDFMDKTLFEPLGIGNSTTIGYQEDSSLLRAGRYVVDSQGTLHFANAPEYSSSGAEAAAIGGYSCIADLDKIFTALLLGHHNEPVINSIDHELVKILRKDEIKNTEDLIYTKLGLRITKLNSSIIGSMSTNQLMFPDKKFATYAVAPNLREEVEIYYHAGSAVGCGCAYSLLPHEDKEKSFSVVVLTNTSGPVDASDHILRLILRQICSMMSPAGKLSLLIPKFPKPKDIRKMVAKGWEASSKAFKCFEDEDSTEGLDILCDISGTFKMENSSQTLEVKTINGKHLITFHGGAGPSRELRLVWISRDMVRICVPESVEPRLSMDRLGDADWADLTFRVTMAGNVVQRLERNTALGKDLLDRQSSV